MTERAEQPSAAATFRKIALKHHLSTFVQGEDGFGGENEPNEKALAAIEEAYNLGAGSQPAAGPQWISVEERLPDNDDSVLFGWWNSHPNLRVPQYCIEIGMYRVADNYWEAERTGPQDEPIRFANESEQVTHWMPLPVAPQKEKSAK